MLANAVDITTGNALGTMQVEPGMLPRVGEKIVIEHDATWEVVDILWTEHPNRLRPMLAMRAIRKANGDAIPRDPLDPADIDIMARAALADIDAHAS